MTESEIIVQISNNQQKIDLLVADRKKLLCQIEELDALKGKYRALECRIQENFYVGSLRCSRYAESTVKNRTLQKYTAGMQEMYSMSNSQKLTAGLEFARTVIQKKQMQLDDQCTEKELQIHNLKKQNESLQQTLWQLRSEESTEGCV